MVRSLPMDHANIIKFFYAGVGVAEKKMVCFILSEFCPDKVWNMGVSSGQSCSIFVHKHFHLQLHYNRLRCTPSSVD